MTRSFALRQLAPLLARAALTLLVLAMFAPAVAEAGCSHLVTPRIDSQRFSSIIEPLIDGLARQREGLPVLPLPRPCSGALCSGQPAAPAVPSVAIDVPPDSWAWNAPDRRLVLTAASNVSPETRHLHPTRLAIAVFRPPPSHFEAA
jgi:hypothetical protein